jgi:hypothetical protein
VMKMRNEERSRNKNNAIDEDVIGIRYKKRSQPSEIKHHSKQKASLIMQDCKHGYPPAIRSDGRDPHRIAIRALLEMLDENEQRYGPDGCGRVTAPEFLTKYSHVVDETMVKHILASGTKIILMKESNSIMMARALAEVCTCLRSFILGQQHQVDSTGPDGESDWDLTSRKLFNEIASMDSDRAVIKYFAKRVSCHCLADERRETRQGPKTGRCMASGCGRRVIDSSLMNCAGCRLVKYCSKECQKADWSNHKELCKEARVKTENK